MRFWSPIVVAVFLSGCDGRLTDSGSVPESLSEWLSIEVPAPEVSEVVMPGNGSFGRVAEEAYGHRNFAGFLAVANGLNDPDLVEKGATYLTPGLEDPFEQSRLNDRSLAATHVLAVATTRFYGEILPEYLTVRQAGEDQPGRETRIELDSGLKERLLDCAEMIDAAATVLGDPGSGLDTPEETVGQFQSAGGYLRELATGSVDGYGYDYDMVGQRLGLGFTYLLIWAFES